MGIMIQHLENVKYYNTKIIARCPACAEQGRDRKGEHLVIFSDGRFACAINPGVGGHEHRKKIYALVGLKNKTWSTCTIKPKKERLRGERILQDDVLGHLGHLFSILSPEKSNKLIYKKDSEKSVPDVPKQTLYYSDVIKQ